LKKKLVQMSTDPFYRLTLLDNLVDNTSAQQVDR